jgi:AcrR family transcriptional regulator
MRLTRAEAKEQTRQRLVDAADREFVEKGFHGTSLSAIAEAADLTTGAVFSSFAGKADLFLAVWERRLDIRLAELDELGSQEGGSFGSRRTSAQWFEKLERERDWHIAALEFRLHAARDPGLNRRFMQLNRRFWQGTGAAFAAMRPGLSDEQQEVLGRAMLALGNGYGMERLTDPERVSGEELALASRKMVGGLLAHWNEAA